MKQKSRLISLQQGLVRRQKRLLKEYIAQTPELEKYYDEYRREVAEFDVISYPDELIERIVRCDVVYVGDFHTLVQAQKLASRLLEMAVRRDEVQGRPVVMAMEAFRASHQGHLDRFNRNEIDVDELFAAANYRRTWGFPAEGYRGLVEVCRRLGVSIVGLNSKPRSTRSRLKTRDERAAGTIAALLRRQPECLVFVLIGDLHVATCHLPLAVLEATARAGHGLRDLIIYSNPESIYWQLSKMGLCYMVNVVKMDNRRFGVSNSTPSAKYDSYLRFMEGVVEEVDADHWGGVPFAASTLEEQVVDFARQICRYLGLRVHKLPDFEVASFDHETETVAQLCRRHGAKSAEATVVRAALKARMPVQVGPNALLIHRFTFNDAADAAARLVLRAFGWQPVHRRNEHSFYYNLVFQALTYFASKAISPKRTCKREEDLRRWAGMQRLARQPTGRSTGQLGVVERYVLPHLHSVRQSVESGEEFDPHQPAPWRSTLARQMETSRLVGNRLGERLFYSAQVGLPAAAVKQGRNRRLSTRQIADLVQAPPALTDSVALYSRIWRSTADVQEHHTTRSQWL